MFIRHAESEFTAILDTKIATSIFEELVANNSTDLAKISTLEEDNPLKQNYNQFRRICEKKDDRLAIITRAISAHETYGPNKNGDAFSREQLEKFHKTFYLKPHLWDHKMEIPYVRGIIGDANWNKKGDYVETLIFIDRDNFPKYASNVEKGLINSFSMGVEVKKAICSICNNIARTPNDLCEHAKHYKGLQVPTNEGLKLAFEFNEDLNFIEQSAVVSPADPDSHTLQILASVKSADHKDIQNLRKLAAILDSYTSTDKQMYLDEYYMIETATSRMADRIARDLNIRFDRR